MTPTDASRPQRFANLSPARKRLVEIFGRVQFGRIDGLAIVAGEPHFFDPAPIIVRTIKVPSEAADAQVPVGDFVLKKPILELFDRSDVWQNVTITRLEFRRGLPIIIEITESEIAEAADSAGRCE
jgi:hypothetical protein